MTAVTHSPNHPGAVATVRRGYGRAIDRGPHASLYRSLSSYRDLIDAYEQEQA